MTGWYYYLFPIVAAAILPPLSLWLRLLVLRHCARVPDDDLAPFALKEAASGRVVELIHAVRGKEPREPPEPELSGRTVVDPPDGAGLPGDVASGGKHAIGSEPAGDSPEASALVAVPADLFDHGYGDEARSA
jgi:hypothetical protein